MGFIPDIEEICTKLPPNRQTLLFSATMPPPIKKLTERFLSNPKQIEVARAGLSNALIDQKLVNVASSRVKRDVLRHVLRSEDVKTAIVFCNRKTTVRELAVSLNRHGFSASQIHGDMEQPERLRELDRFKAGEINILVASDVAARGLDIKGVSHVFNFDVPWHPDDYVHRIGRTGRAGAKGQAFTLVTSEDGEAVEAIEKLIGEKIPRIDMRGGEKQERPAKPAEPAVKSKSRPAEERDGERPPVSSAPKASRQAPVPQTAAVSKPAPAPNMVDGPDEGWNGPVPGFLSVGFN
jgi:superfamily II DNA/RNA helicase